MAVVLLLSERMQHRSNGHIVDDLGTGRGHGQRALLSLCDDHLAADDERSARRGKRDRQLAGAHPVRARRSLDYLPWVSR